MENFTLNQIRKVITVLKYFIAALIVCLVLSLFFSCRSTKHIELRQDSIIVETMIETVYVPELVFVNIPLQTTQITTPDSSSHLENDYAESTARINSDGTLYHDLLTKPQKVAEQVMVPVTTKTKYEKIYHDVNIVLEKEKLVEKELSWWQKFRLSIANIVLIALGLWIGYGLFRAYRMHKGL